ncbi:MAG: hypothetical protein ISP74_01870 [Bacteroidia bacterium]|nr:hypothetical protein [Bacteroidia bacterium]
MKRYFYTIIIVLSIVSCDNLQTVIDVDLPPHEPKLVVNSVNEVGEKWKAYVSVSQAPLSTSDFVFLSDALVLLIDGETTIDTLTYNAPKNRYESSRIVQEGTNFEIQVSHSKYNTINATLFPFQKVFLKSVEELQDFSSETTSLKFTIDDPQSTNYYMINLKAYYSQDAFDTTGIWDDYYSEMEKIYFDSDDPSLNQGQFSSGKVLFDDKLFNGTTKEFNILFDSYVSTKADSILLNLWSVDYAFYNYFTTKIIQSNTGNNPIFNSEPVNVYNSFLDGDGEIQGYGIFAVSSRDSVVIQTD